MCIQICHRYPHKAHNPAPDKWAPFSPPQYSPWEWDPEKPWKVAWSFLKPLSLFNKQTTTKNGYLLILCVRVFSFQRLSVTTNTLDSCSPKAPQVSGETNSISCLSLVETSSSYSWLIVFGCLHLCPKSKHMNMRDARGPLQSIPPPDCLSFHYRSKPIEHG